MNDYIWYDFFFEGMYKKYPQKSELTEALMDLLSIEREATYRRLRKEVIFPLEEVVKIADAWNISLDEMIGNNTTEVIFKGRIMDFINPTKEDLSTVKQAEGWYEALKSVPDLEYLEVCNKIPRSLHSAFPNLMKLQVLRWLHQHGSIEVIPFSQLEIDKDITRMVDVYNQITRNFNNSSYIWDNMLFLYAANDIRYLQSIDLINNEDKELIKNDLRELLDYMAKVAMKGSWSETDNKVNLYISHVNIETNYSYIHSESQNLHLSIVRAFMKGELYTTNKIFSENFRNWMQLKKRSSVLISEADERSRIDFFRKQYAIVGEL